jgi:hypothetical protein
VTTTIAIRGGTGRAVVCGDALDMWAFIIVHHCEAALSAT